MTDTLETTTTARPARGRYVDATLDDYGAVTLRVGEDWAEFEPLAPAATPTERDEARAELAKLRDFLDAVLNLTPEEAGIRTE